MLVSVVIPFYNEEKDLKNAIRSICNQKYQNIEILLVDNGSTDRSYQIAKSFEKIDPRIRVLQEWKPGVNHARKKGFLEASGEYIYFMDADDIVSKYGLSTLVDVLERSGADFVQGDFKFYENEAQLKHFKKYENDSGALPYCDVDSFLRVNASLWTNLYRRDLIQEHFFVDLDYMEDSIFNQYAYLYAKKVVDVLEIVYYYNCTKEEGLSYMKKPMDLYHRLNVLGQLWHECLEQGKLDQSFINLTIWDFNSLYQEISRQMETTKDLEQVKLLKEQLKVLEIWMESAQPEFQNVKGYSKC